MGELELSGLRLHRAGKSSSLEAEELTFEKTLRQSPTVDRDERTIPTIASIVDRFGYQLLTGSARSGKKDGSSGSRHLRDDLVHFRDALRFTHHISVLVLEGQALT